MGNISLLDCTLRDGGHVNNFDFGFDNILKIIKGLSTANVDIVEIGFLMDATYEPDKTIFQNVQQAEALLPTSEFNSEYSLMIRPDWYNINQLEASSKIQNLRFAFHEIDLELVLIQARYARDLGYRVFLNPVNITGYSLADVKELLMKLGDFNPDGVSIVDTFGSMQESDLLELYQIFEENLDSSVTLGLHLHENLSLSLSLAQKFLEIRNPERNVIVDSSVLGMGRIPGNLPTELIMNTLMSVYGKHYHVSEVLALAGNPIAEIKSRLAWGYSPEYAVSAFLKIHRSYPEYLVATLGYDFEKASVLMSEIAKSGVGGTFSKDIVDKIVNKLN